MSFTIEKYDIVRPSSGKHTGIVIFLHGSGGNGILSKAWVRMLRENTSSSSSFPHIKIIYPTAAQRPYTPLGGQLSNVWFDRVEISPDCPEHLETINSMAESLVKLIEEENRSGIPLNRIVVGGFSMGGAMALHLAFRFVPDIAGVFSLSSFLNNDSIVYKELKEKKLEKLPSLFHAHGDDDNLVLFRWGQDTFEQLNKLGVQGVFHTIPDAEHELKEKTVDLLYDWINQLLPNH